MIYVMCPANIKTGGTELLHQLVYQLMKQGKEARIVYSGYKSGESPMPYAFKEYIDNYLLPENIEDNERNVLVVSEVECEYLAQYSKMKKYIWWLSVDNYVARDGFLGRMKVQGLKTAVSLLLKGKIIHLRKYIKLADRHLCQSYYAIEYVKSLGVPQNKIFYLSDYINDMYIENEETIDRDSKKKYVLYNPAKGIVFTKRLIAKAPDIDWKPLKNMTTEQVAKLMQKSMVYIDFGNHPGKDRIPREAAISGCCIITGRKGSAAFVEDVKIPDTFKFDENETNVENKVISKIRECLNDYSSINSEFDSYRDYIRNEKNKFSEDVDKIFR